MTFVRRMAMVVIGIAGLFTCVTGVWFCAAIDDFSGGRFNAYSVIGTVVGGAATLSGAGCAYMAARDLPRASLSSRATRWTWAATFAFSLVAFATAWFLVLGLPGPIITAFFVRIARGPRGPAAGEAAPQRSRLPGAPQGGPRVDGMLTGS